MRHQSRLYISAARPPFYGIRGDGLPKGLAVRRRKLVRCLLDNGADLMTELGVTLPAVAVGVD